MKKYSIITFLVNLNEVLKLMATTSRVLWWETFQVGVSAVSEWTDLPQGGGEEGVSSLGGGIIHIDQLLAHTHNTQHNTHSQYDEQIPMIYGNGHFVWPFSSICGNIVGWSNG